MKKIVRRLQVPVLSLLAVWLLAAGWSTAMASEGRSERAGRRPARSDRQASTVGISPPGANRRSCRLSREHPFPVVLVHGTFESMAQNWLALSPVLAAGGYCVFALNYGNHATGPVADSARELGAFVDEVLATTGASKVSIVGHSQGGMMPRHYIRFLGGGAKIDELIGLAPSNHGTEHPFVPLAEGLGCAACRDQAAGSAFLARLNEGRDVEPGVDYTVIASRLDAVVIPYTSAFLAGPPQQVTNVTVQDRCLVDLSGHVALAYDPVAFQWVLDALGRRGPADPFLRPACYPGVPL